MGIVEILKTSSCEEIESFCMNRFAYNLSFFQKEYPELFKSLQKPAEKYQLYIGKEGVNILNMRDNSFFYALEDNQSTMLSIHEKCAFNPPINEYWNRIYGSKAAKMDERFLYSSIWVNGILDFTAENGGVEHYHLPSNFLPNLSLFGLGGGIFLQILAERYQRISNFFIFEESLDLFRIACFFVDFMLLFNKTENKAGYIFIEGMNKRYALNFFSSRRISTSVMRFEFIMYQSAITQSAKSIIQELHSQSLRGWGTYEDEVMGIINKKSFSLSPMLLEPKRINAPICVVAAGASLDSLLPFIKKNQNRMIIFSCGTALKPLLKARIKPDFQIEIERHTYLHEILKEAPLGDIPLLCASVLDARAKNLAEEIYLFERDGSSAANLNAPKFKVKFTAPLVGNAGAALASYLGSDVLLCGLDCGYKKGARKHAKNSYYGKEEQKIPENAYKVDGNFSEDIYSDALYSLSRTSLEEAFKSLKPFNILNLSDGAYIKGAIPTNYEDFELKAIDKKESLRQLKSLFKDPKKYDFYTKENDRYWFEVITFKNQIHDLFKTKVTSKIELFSAADKIFAQIALIEQKDPFIGILFGGSLSHFLFTLVLCSIHLPHDNVEDLWKKARELYIEGMEKMVANLQEVFQKMEH